MNRACTLIVLSLLTALSTLSSPAWGQALPDPDGQPADMTQPVQVFILLGQSNMVGAGHVTGDNDHSLQNACTQQGLYPYLVDDAGNWTTRMDVRNVRTMGSGNNAGRLLNNEWMTVSGRTLGPEYGIGHQLGNAIEAPVMVLKSCIGNRSLGWDLLPPGSEHFQWTDADGQSWEYAGYGESPMRWQTGTTPEAIGWRAGVQYDGDIANAKRILEDLATYYPGANGYEIAGFFFWQGDKDRYDAGLASRYEHNLTQLIQQLRVDFNAPNAKFVCATLGQTEHGATGNEGLILEAQLAVSNAERHPEFVGNVATVYSHPLSMGGASNGHYGGDARTYMNIGQAMGAAMVELLATDQ